VGILGDNLYVPLMGTRRWTHPSTLKVRNLFHIHKLNTWHIVIVNNFSGRVRMLGRTH